MTTAPDTLVELIEHGAKTWSDRLMIRSRQGDTVTYAEYRDRVEAMAAGLAELGVGPGDVVSWILPTWVDTIVLAGALSRLGAVQNPIIAIYRDREVGFCCEQAGTSLLITLFCDTVTVHGGEAWLGSLARALAPCFFKPLRTA